MRKGTGLNDRERYLNDRNIVRRGIRKNTVCRRSLFLFCMLFLLFFILFPIENKGVFAKNSSGYQAEDAKKGVIEVQTGLKGQNDKFYPVRTATGFLISNRPNSVYIITTNRAVQISEKEKKKLCKAKKLDYNMSGLNTEIRIIVEGDVASSVTVDANSQKEDFCVLSARDVLKEKTSLRIGSEQSVRIGDEVYAVGIGNNGTDSGRKVPEIHAGTIQDTKADLAGNIYLQHSAVIQPEQSGGALISKDGYLIGMNNAFVKKEGITAYYSLPISKIQSILDNYGVSYESREKDEAFAGLEKTYKEAKKQLDSGKYKRESTELLETALQGVKEQILESKNDISLTDIKEARKKLEQGETNLVKKTSKIKVIKYILLCFLIIAATRAVSLGVRYRGMKKAGARRVDLGNVETGKNQSRNEYFVNGEKQDLLGLEPDMEKDETVYLQSGQEGEGTVILSRSGSSQKRAAVLKNSITGEQRRISAQNFTIGKNADNDLQIDKNTISRNHAVIHLQNGNFYIEDLESSNGTFVNGKEVQGRRVKLLNHDIITLAEEEWEFVMK